MKPKLACADFTFPLLPHDKVLDLIAMLEMDGVDIGLFEDRSHLQPSDIFKDIKGNAKLLKKKLEDRGLKPADIFLQTALDFESFASNHPDKRVREKARELYLKTLEFTVECGGEHVSALPGVYFEEESEEDSYARCCEELNWRCEKAQEYNLIFGVEAHIGSIASAPKEALQLVNDVPNLTLTLDYTHFTKLGIPDQKIEPLIKFASHFHARGAREGKPQASMDDNTIDYERVVKVMKETGYEGYIGLEYVWQDWEQMNEVDNLSETIRLRDLILEVY